MFLIMFSLIWALICGSLIGWIAGKIMHDEGSTLRNIVVGIVGSGLGRWLFAMVGFYNTTGIADVIVCVIGACVLLMLVNMISRR